MQELWLAGRGVGKARPRFGRGGKVYTSDQYGFWKKDAIAQIKSLNLPPAPKPCYVECYFVNFLSSDADNLQGAVLDAMVQAEFLQNDSSSYVVGCSGIFVKQPKEKKLEKAIGILIRVTPANVSILSDTFNRMSGTRMQEIADEAEINKVIRKNATLLPTSCRFFII
jgi:Holliday junction resolvase RusA-like endonuclease